MRQVSSRAEPSRAAPPHPPADPACRPRRRRSGVVDSRRTPARICRDWANPHGTLGSGRPRCDGSGGNHVGSEASCAGHERTRAGHSSAARPPSTGRLHHVKRGMNAIALPGHRTGRGSCRGHRGPDLPGQPDAIGEFVRRHRDRDDLGGGDGDLDPYGRDTDAPSESATPAAPSGDRPATNVPMTKLAPGEKPPQFIIFSFDGAGSHQRWGEFMAAADETNSRFTGFLSGHLPDRRFREGRGRVHRPRSRHREGVHRVRRPGVRDRHRGQRPEPGLLQGS